MSPSHDLAIIGAGAAGLASAIFAAQSAPHRRIILLDGAKTIGAKILVSGGGRCNVTHDQVTPEDFNAPRNIVKNILAAFDAAATVKWFASLGVELKREETGKLFPVTDSAKTVLAALLRRCAELGVEIRTTTRVKEIMPGEESHLPFTIQFDGGQLRSPRLILATGGRSLPRSGSDGSGWELARRLGHTVTSTYAALVPLVLDARMFHAQLAGIAHPAGLSTYASGKLIDRRTGDLLWTHFGISGPVVMDASRHWIIAHETGAKPELRCNFLPGEGFETLEQQLIALCSLRPRAAIATVLSGKLPERVLLALLAHLHIPASLAAGQLSRDARRSLVHALTALPLPVTSHRGWNYAEVTAGGIPLSEVNYRTMESRKTPGLFFAGEILDCDGRIGGFNFQWAWSTGYLAGRASVR